MTYFFSYSFTKIWLQLWWRCRGSYNSKTFKFAMLKVESWVYTSNWKSITLKHHKSSHYYLTKKQWMILYMNYLIKTWMINFFHIWRSNIRDIIDLEKVLKPRELFSLSETTIISDKQLIHSTRDLDLFSKYTQLLSRNIYEKKTREIN